MEEALRHLLYETRKIVAANPTLARYADDALTAPAYRPLEPVSLPAVRFLPDCREIASAETLPLTEAIIAAAPYLRWRQSYSEEQVGPEFLAGYGWFNLTAPDGPFVSDTHRISFGYWSSGLYYPRHWHEPEEVYFVIGGSALFLRDGAEPRQCGPGETVEHVSNQPHAAEMTPGPLLAMAIWRGTKLIDVPELDGADVRWK